MSYAVAKDIFFATRNTGKVTGGDVGRVGALSGQMYNAVNGIAKYDNAVGKTAKSALNVLSNASKNSKAIGYVSKGLEFASKNVNPLLCVAAGVRVITSKDKEKAAIRESLGMGTMFAFEACAKRFLAKAVLGSALKGIGLASMTNPVSAAIFVGMSIAGYYIGNKIGKEVTGTSIDDKIAETKEKNKAIQTQQPKKVETKQAKTFIA